MSIIQKDQGDVNKKLTSIVDPTLKNFTKSNSDLHKAVTVFSQETLVKLNEITTLVTENRVLAENENIISFEKLKE